MTKKQRIERLEDIVIHLFNQQGYKLKLDYYWEDYQMGYKTSRTDVTTITMRERINAILEHLKITLHREFPPPSKITIKRIPKKK